MGYEYIEPDWDDPASLRACAARLKLQAAQMQIEANKYAHLVPVEINPFADLVSEDPAEAETREADFAAAGAAQAKREILEALAKQEEAAKQQAHREFYRTPIGRLLR